MSRVGKKPIVIPSGVETKIAPGKITVKGPLGEISQAVNPRLEIKRNDNQLMVERQSNQKMYRELHGLTRNLIANMVTGVTTGYQRVLEIVGVGYRAQVQGSKIIVALGYSHPIEFNLPDGITAAVDQKQTQITLTGIDKQKIGQIAANLKTLRKTDIYKGKGIRYAGQRLKLKVGKTGKK